MTAMHFATRELETPLGDFEIAATTEGLTHCQLAGSRRLPPADDDGAQTKVHLDAGESALARYFAGEKDPWDGLVLAPAGTEFQRQVWDALQSIPYGETRSYGEQARSIERPKAVRAVASANGDNPISIIIPCHRVIGSDGSLTGYGGGLPRKQYLLGLERRIAGGELQLEL